MKPASVVLALLLSTMMAGVSAAQSNGVPASVTSFGFGGSRNQAPGVPAGVTSLGPRGFGPSNSPNGSQCCPTQFFPTLPTHVGPFTNSHHHHGNGNGNGHNNGFNNNNYGIYPGYAPIYSYGGYYPGYAPTIVAQQEEVGGGTDEDTTDEGGPTVFEHRGARRPPTEEAYSRGYEEGRASAEDTRHDHHRADADRDRKSEDRDAKSEDKADSKAEAAPAPAIVPKTVLVYKDAHKEEIANYAIVGDQLFDFTNGKRKIAVADLDLPATTKANDARGVDFQLPAVRAKK